MFGVSSVFNHSPRALLSERRRAPSAMREEGDVPLAARRDVAPLFTVIVPAYDEERTLSACLRRTLAAAPGSQIILVDDGSSDGTAAIARSFIGPGLLLLSHQRNRGKGAAIRTALRHAQGEFTIIQDADLEYDPCQYASLLAPLLSGAADAVYGSRYLGGFVTIPGRRRFDWGVKVLNAAIRLLYGVRFTDEATCYKAFATSALKTMDLQCERFEFCAEVTAKACRLGLRVKEVPISYTPRGVRDGKKLRLRDGFHALRVLWKFRSWRPEPSFNLMENDSDAHRV